MYWNLYAAETPFGRVSEVRRLATWSLEHDHGGALCNLDQAIRVVIRITDGRLTCHGAARSHSPLHHLESLHCPGVRPRTSIDPCHQSRA